MERRYDKTLRVLFFGLFSIFLTATVFSQNMFRKVNDFDGDGKADFAVTRNIGGYKYWYIWQSAEGFKVFQWGLDTDQNAAGDYDGDNRVDIAVMRVETVSADSSKYTFWIYGSQTGIQKDESITPTYFGVVPHQQDYDGDNRTDVSFTTGNSSAFLVKYSNGGPAVFANMSGIPIKIGDFTGDGKAELAVFDPGDRNVYNRIAPNATVSRRFGEPGDIFVPADFDGDNKGDLAIFRPSTNAWWWQRSSDGIIKTESFGAQGDIPVPADYDGDGKTDIAIWRSGPQSYFWVKGSQAGVYVLAWGVNGDSVVKY